MAAPAVAVPGIATFRIPTMDCPVEEGEIRQVLERIAGIRSLSFQLGARTLAINAPADVVPLALEAIRSAGYAPQPLLPPPVAGDGAPAENHADHDHEMGTSITRLALALALALGAEALHFFAPETTLMNGLGLVIAAVAIWLSGIETYTKGLAALRR
ncbi:MAG TPA: cation transporter, partial [Rhizobacter sp.]|nr:cation transporter [Rhizobacter sp.]